MKIFGGYDILMGLFLIFLINFDFPWRFLFILGVILMAKASLGMLQDFGSWVDFLCGFIVLVAIILPIPGFIGIIFGVLIIQKGIFSFI